jgi:tyrosyl-tRNA synthetase
MTASTPATPAATAQHELLIRGTEEVLPEHALLGLLERCARERRPLRVKQGFDPTSADIHLGHAVGLRKLRQFQDLGHQVVLIVGDYTGMVGDPSGANKTRPRLDEAQIEANARTYFEQFYKVLDPAPAPPRLPVEVRRNGEWFSKMAFMDVMKLASEYTVARMLERDDFAKRYAAHQPISVHELFYPLMQGYDSVAIRADIELGGTDQKFNLLVGRTLQELHEQAPQVIMTLPILEGLDGVQKMSKSLGNYVGVNDMPADMFGKIMSIPDRLLPAYWRLAAGLAPEAEDAELKSLEAGLENPMLSKKRLASQIVARYHGESLATQAQEAFEAQFSRKEAPDQLETFGRGDVERVAAGGLAPRIVEYVVAAGLAPSKGAARRLIEQGAVSVDGDRSASTDHAPRPDAGFVLRVGRRMKRYEP